MAHHIHHITAIASDPQACLYFYRDILGLRLVKKTVNQDQVEAYHLFFGDKIGSPGMDLTFFTFPGARQGKAGVGAVSKISLAVPEDSLFFWQDRLQKNSVSHEPIFKKFGFERIIFFDQDGQQLELVGVDRSTLETIAEHVWETPEVPREHAIRCFHSATLLVENLGQIEPILTNLLGFSLVSTDKNTALFGIAGAIRGGFLEVVVPTDKTPVYNSAGTVHHIAFAVANATELEEKRTQIKQLDLLPTQIIDRFYFQSVYFRTPAGILFELATHGPGFTADEKLADLGKNLALPPFLEPYRSEIEQNLVPIT